MRPGMVGRPDRRNAQRCFTSKVVQVVQTGLGLERRPSSRAEHRSPARAVVGEDHWTSGQRNGDVALDAHAIVQPALDRFAAR